ncbi:hypothetical protein QYF61_002491 [Mycteria americana]|uniref:Integrase catalytic domain-containing protein n=1 Tax=Mycteria americana TaxID=33587 RepID=A0AAN7NQN1_MYCAM|nr:hypothetical protein QYF61_002491 [Mycteria americana]
MTGENSQRVQGHFHGAFVALGVPREIKTDNVPAYISHTMHRFFHTQGINHKTGIPHSPTGQAIIERTHRTLKTLLQKQKKGEAQESPQNRLGKALYVMNHLSLPFQHEDIPPIVKHYKAMESGLTPILREKAMVMMKNLNTGCWEGPSRAPMGTSTGSSTLVRSIILLSIIIGLSEPWVSVQPRNNIWVTLANMTGQEHVCLSMASAGNPFTTCLVSIPLRSLEYEGLVNRTVPSVSIFLQINNGTGAMDQ